MKLTDLLEFFDPPITIGFDVTPDTAIDYLKAKGLKPGFSYADALADENAASFTIAKMMDADLLADVKASLEDALATGKPFKEWADSILPALQAKGWVGRKAVLDPITGQTIVAPLGTPGRLQTIFRTNMQSAYSVGQWEQIAAQAEEAPFLMYDAIDDFRTRPEHAARDGQIHPVNSKFWKTYFPPCGWNCRCSAIQLSQDEMDELGLSQSPRFKFDTYSWTNPRTGKVEQIPMGVDPGFGFNVGQKRLEALAKLAVEKAKALPSDAAEATLAGLDAASELAAKNTIDQAAKRAADMLAATKAAERAAANQIAKALDNKTPYLAKAIQQVQATKVGQEMSPVQVLKAAKEKAAKLESSAWLSEYKKASLAGKTPNAKAKAAFDALPDEAQAAMTAQIEAQAAELKLQAAAQAELDAINPNSVAGKALAKIDAESLKPSEILAQVKAAESAAIAKQVQAQGLAGYKKAAIAGKIPSAKQKAAFDALDDDGKAKLLDEIDQAKAKPAPAPAEPDAAPPAVDRYSDPSEINTDTLVQTGPQAGSNPGGEFTDTSTGIRWYIKYPDAPDALRNEALANALYRLAGVEVPDIRLIEFKGRPAIASRIVDGLKVDRKALTSGRVAGVQEHFGVDAWLANWDVIGPDYANTKLGAGRGLRIDPGGSLRYRAQGGMKGEVFGDQVVELESMRHGGTNSHAASVFKYATEADIEDGVRRILSIPEADIRRAVDELGPLDRGGRDKLLKTLLARRADLARRYPNAVPVAPEALPLARVTELEQRQIEASRANGYSIQTDSGQIEDHHVLVNAYTDANGKAKTRATMKLRPEAAAKLQGSIGMTGADPSIDLSAPKAKLKQLVVGVNKQADGGQPIRDTDKARFMDLRTMVKDAITRYEASAGRLADPTGSAKTITELKDLLAEWEQYFATHKIGDKATKFRQLNVDGISTRLEVKPEAGKVGGINWQRESEFRYPVSQISKGYMRETNQSAPAVYGVNVAYRAEIAPGVSVRYVPDVSNNVVTMRGYLQIDIDGATAASSARAFEAMERLGLNAARATKAERIELYVDRHLYIRTLRNPDLDAKWSQAAAITDQDARIKAKVDLLSADAGFDVTRSRHWDPEGKHQAFGHGRAIQNRADLGDKDVEKFKTDYLIYHNPTNLRWSADSDLMGRFKMLIENGGQLSSLSDRVRRGVVLNGSSVQGDMNSGGGNYVFTRLTKRSGGHASKNRGAGFYLKPELALRSDSFSYGGDKFGSVDRGLQRQERAVDLAGMRSNARNGGNETNFRDTVSLFDAVEHIVMRNQSEVDEAIAFMKANGYNEWPDGRALADVILPPSKFPYP